jgi:hypothetical protein
MKGDTKNSPFNVLKIGNHDAFLIMKNAIAGGLLPEQFIKFLPP